MADAIPHSVIPPAPPRIDSGERDLLTRVRVGDPQAFATLVEQYLEQVTRVAYYIVGSRDAADDVAQIVFVQIWEQRAVLDPARPIKPYLLRAVRNRALDERKADAVRSRHRLQAIAEATAGTVAAVVPSPEGAVLSAATVQAAVARLSERRQLALRLRLEEQLTHAEIGHILDIAPAAAERLVARALQEVREILGVLD